MIPVKITKEITFDMAHMLSNYNGKCANLHGHTYKLQVTVEGEVDEDSRMVIDFNRLKEAIEDCVMERLDHAVAFSDTMFRGEAEDELLKWAEKYGMKYQIIANGKTTCENMAVEIKKLLNDYLFNDGFHCKVFVKLWETPTSFAEF